MKSLLKWKEIKPTGPKLMSSDSDLIGSWFPGFELTGSWDWPWVLMNRIILGWALAGYMDMQGRDHTRGWFHLVLNPETPFD